MQTLRHSLITLGVALLFLVGLYVYSFYGGPAWLKDVSLSVGTTVLGILMTVLLIDMVIRRNEQFDRDRVIGVAFAQMRLPLLLHIRMLQGMYKAALAHMPSNPPLEMENLFGSDYTVQLAFLDFSKPAPILNVQPLTWFDYLHHEIAKFKSAVSRTIEKYATFLEPETVELLESMIASSLLGLLEQAVAIPPIDRQQGFNRQYNLLCGQGVADLIKQHTDLVLKLVFVANSELPREKQLELSADLWRVDVAPQFGSARI